MDLRIEAEQKLVQVSEQPIVRGIFIGHGIIVGSPLCPGRVQFGVLLGEEGLLRCRI